MNHPKTLLVGPLPPPVGGASISFQTFVHAWEQQMGPAQHIVNTSAGYFKTTRKLKLRDLLRGVRVAWQLWWKAPRDGVVLAFVNVGFYMRYASFLTLLQSIRNTSVIVSFFGGGLYTDICNLAPDRRATILHHLNQLHGIIVETDYLRTGLFALGLTNITNVPGYRSIDWMSLPISCPGAERSLRVVFLSHVRREKGVLDLVDAVALATRQGRHVVCDIYGPVTADIADEFAAKCATTSGVTYKGVASGNIPSLLAQYDLLALPSYYEGEGHPGVVIESMMAGIPVLASTWRSLPELVRTGENGVLVEPHDVEGLASALCHLADQLSGLASMGVANRSRLNQHDVCRAVQVVHAIVQAPVQS